MNEKKLYEILMQVKNGQLDIKDAYQALKILPYEEMGFAKLDHHRAIRDNFPEVIYCEGKTTEQIVLIFQRLVQQNNNIIGTRANLEIYNALKNVVSDIQINPVANLLYIKRFVPPTLGRIAVVTGGTADMPVAEEAAQCLEVMGGEVDRIYDVGVAGIHRLLDKVEQINRAQVIIVAAGMEGALASVVGGLFKQPVIAVPTSVGYGASFKGLAALLSMLNSCAAGVGVVNIDNGYGAAALAIAILNTQASR
ncbi:MAG: nickel pincer cofactor biosynthesis protein LarB [Syntrophomonas sp.]|nr:nickel pincer cofactor biosynthesis protein LarB [Syntrophomonas sp.]